MGSATTSPTTPEPGLADDASGTSRQGTRLVDRALPRVGHLLSGKYRIDGILGRGGMGVVAAGHQLNLDRAVAIKFLRHTLGESARQRFTREAMAVAKIQSDHVVRVFDAGEENGAPFIVMERLVGNDLAEELQRGPLEPELAVKYLLEACEALTEAHALGIIHRDLKPSNLYVTRASNGRRSLKVLDFGVSKWLQTAPDGETPLSTAETGIIGTPAYVSPEQLTTPNAVDERSDIWSLGVALYQCLSGKRPFEGRGVPQLCAAILAAQPTEFDPALEIPETLAAIVRRRLRKKPEERYQSVGELSNALGSFRTPRTAVDRARDALRGGRGRVLVALLAVAVAATAGASVVFRPNVERVGEPESLGKPAVDAARQAVAPEPLPARIPEPNVQLEAKEVVAPGPSAPSASPSSARPRGEGRRVPPRRTKAEPTPSATAAPPVVETSGPVVQPPAKDATKPMYRR